MSVELATSLVNLGLVQNQLGRNDLAQESYRLAINQFEQLRVVQPRDIQIASKTALAYNNLAASYLDMQPKRAIELYRHALDLLPNQHTEGWTILNGAAREMAITLNNLGRSYSRTDELDEALHCYLQASEIEQRLVTQSPAHWPYQNDLAVTQNNLGMVLTRLGCVEDATAAFQRALEIQETLTKLAPHDGPRLSNIAGI